jgi:hypothetical protein
LRNAFNGEAFIFTHALEDSDVAQFDVYLEPNGMLAGTGMHHVHPFADEEFLVKTGRLALSIDGAPGTRTGAKLRRAARRSALFPERP